MTHLVVSPYCLLQDSLSIFLSFSRMCRQRFQSRTACPSCRQNCWIGVSWHNDSLDPALPNRHSRNESLLTVWILRDWVSIIGKRGSSGVGRKTHMSVGLSTSSVYSFASWLCGCSGVCFTVIWDIKLTYGMKVVRIKQQGVDKWSEPMTN